VVAYVGGDSTLIDTTLRTDDNVPGEVTVRTHGFFFWPDVPLPEA
jgi:hypothetical protein